MKNLFNSFSEAFRYAVDSTGLNHVEFYEKINMDKSQWSKVYNGDIENPQRKTRNKLSEVVGVEIRKNSDGWYVEDPSRSQFDQLNEEIIDYDSKVSDHIKLELLLDDPLKTIEYAEGLIRIARLKLENSRRD